MADPRTRKPGRATSRLASLGFTLTVGISSVAGGLLALPHRASAETAAWDTAIVAGPGYDYETLAVAPAGEWVSVDGEAVDGFVPVTYGGVSGWAEAGAVAPDATYDEPVYDEAAAPDVVSEAPAVSEEQGGDHSRDDAAAAPAPESGGAVQNGNYDLTPPDGQSSAHQGQSEYTEDEILGIIRQAAADHGQSATDMERVARCESGLNPYAIGGGGAWYGLFQFVPSTFAGTPYGDHGIFDPWANAQAAAWMWAQGRKGEWSCQ